jgi:hypothetical protein
MVFRADMDMMREPIKGLKMWRVVLTLNEGPGMILPMEAVFRRKKFPIFL